MPTVLTATDGTHAVELTIHHEDEPWLVGDGDYWTPELELHLHQDGSARLSASAYHVSDLGAPFPDWPGFDHRWRRSLAFGALAVADPDRLKAIGEAVLPLLLRVHSGLDAYWDLDNIHGRPTDDALAASEAIKGLMGIFSDEGSSNEGDVMGWQAEGWAAQDAAEWIWEARAEGVTAWTTDEELRALADADEATARAANVLLCGRTYDTRRSARAELRAHVEEAAHAT
jgi:hypothetical protein